MNGYPVLAVLATLRLSEIVQPVNGGYVWDGECGKIKPPPPRKWMGNVSEEYRLVLDLVGEYLLPLRVEDILPYFDPWLARVTGYSKSPKGHLIKDDLGAIALIRAKVGREESDIAIGPAQACDNVKTSIKKFGPDSVKAFFGAHNHDDNGVHEAVVHYCFDHPEEPGVMLKKEISVFKFTTAVKFNSVTSPVCLPKARQRLEIDTRGIVSEWGSFLNDNNEHEGKLRIMAFLVVPNSICRENHFALKPTKDTFCISLSRNHNIEGYEWYIRDGTFTTVEANKLVMHGVYLDTWQEDKKLPMWVTRVSDKIDWLNNIIPRVSALYRDERRVG